MMSPYAFPCSFRNLGYFFSVTILEPAAPNTLHRVFPPCAPAQVPLWLCWDLVPSTATGQWLVSPLPTTKWDQHLMFQEKFLKNPNTTTSNAASCQRNPVLGKHLSVSSVPSASSFSIRDNKSPAASDFPLESWYSLSPARPGWAMRCPLSFLHSGRSWH